jgi:hypothetical protein
LHFGAAGEGVNNFAAFGGESSEFVGDDLFR